MVTGRNAGRRSGRGRTFSFAVVFLVLVSAGPASAGTQGMVVTPAPGSEVSEHGDYFLLDARPGSTVVQSLLIQNGSRRPMTLDLAAVDAATAEFGGVSYGMPEDKPKKVGRWTDLSTTLVRLAPGESRTVDLEVRVPDDLREGVHIGGIAVSKVAGNKTKVSDKPGASVEVRTRSIVALQVNVPGSDQGHIEIRGVDPVARPDGVYLGIDIENTGTGFSKGEGYIVLPEGEKTPLALDTFVPGTSIVYPVRWTETPPSGTYPVEVFFDLGDHTAHYRGEFQITSALQEDLADRLTTGGVPEQSRSGIPLEMMIGASAVLIGLVVLIIRRRRRPKEQGTVHPLPRRVSVPPPPLPLVASQPPPPPAPVVGRSPAPPAPRVLTGPPPPPVGPPRVAPSPPVVPAIPLPAPACRDSACSPMCSCGRRSSAPAGPRRPDRSSQPA